MRWSDRNRVEMGDLQQPFLPDESVETATTIALELRDRLVKVEQQVLAQYTATAAYATIAQQHVDTARAEARADLDRSQATVIGLIERLRGEMNNKFSGHQARSAAVPTAPQTFDAITRLAATEHKIVALTAALEQTARENEELRLKVSSLVDRQMREDGWLASSGSASELSLR